jgi:serine/threonine protein phosphatase 1
MLSQKREGSLLMRVAEMSSSKDRPVYVVGDVHGMYRHLVALIDSILKDAAATAATPRIVFLGDIIDRGDDSFRAMELVAATIKAYPGSGLILGNHEAMFLEVLGDAETATRTKAWLCELGGEATMRSYLGRDADRRDDLGQISTRYPSHVELLRNSLNMVLLDRDYCLVHAGIDPAKPLAAQDEITVQWIREPFLVHRQRFERKIVHGHTITEKNLGPEVYPNRIALDSGAYRGGPLSAAVFAGDEAPRFICAIGFGYGPIQINHCRRDDLTIDYLDVFGAASDRE